VRHLLARLVAAALLAAAAVALPQPPPALAAACSASTGVTVVVDYGSLGGGVGQSCVGTGLASEQFPAAGYPLDYVQGEAGFVCRVKGAPADDPCTETSSERAFWSLWTTDGKSGRWSFASRGVTQLRVSEGGAVAFSWDDVAGYRPPSAAAPVTAPAPTPTAPATASPSPKPTKQPTKQPTKKPAEQPSGQSSSTPASPSAQTSTGQPSAPSATPPSGRAATAPPSPHSSGTSGATPSAAGSPSTGPSTTDGSTGAAVPGPVSTSAGVAPVDDPVTSPAAQQTTQDDGVPAWLVLVLLALLLVSTGAVALQRRRTRSGP
jgi:hypothetical protein